jgi:hypothetical protein
VGSLRLVLADGFRPDPTVAETAIYGAGGAVTAADWIAEVDASAVWQCVVRSGELRYAVLE